MAKQPIPWELLVHDRMSRDLRRIAQAAKGAAENVDRSKRKGDQ